MFSAEGTINAANLGDWEGKLMEVAQMNKHAEEIMGLAHLKLRDYGNAFIDKDGRIVDFKEGEKTRRDLKPFNEDAEQVDSYNKLKRADLFLENADLSFKSAFHQAYKYSDSNQKKKLKKLSEKYADDIDAASRAIRMGDNIGVGIWNPVKKHEVLTESLNKLKELTDPNLGGKLPKIYQEANAFAMDKASETFGNLAMKSYNKLGEKKSPVLAIEPFHPGAGLSSTDDMIKLVKESRKKFAKQLVEDKNFNEERAKKIAESKIGVTWDVGHINMIKKYGFTDKDIVEQTKKIAPMVKHIHLTDNFGHADTHLAPGMGNVPIKDILEELEKTGRLDEMRKITEAGAFVQHFKKSPHPLTMAAFGSPIYGMKSAPYWNQVMDIQGSYFGGYGTVNPSQHHSIYGSGFTTMPVELGGQMPGGQSRLSGTPMA